MSPRLDALAPTRAGGRTGSASPAASLRKRAPGHGAARRGRASLNRSRNSPRSGTRAASRGGARHRSRSASCFCGRLAGAASCAAALGNAAAPYYPSAISQQKRRPAAWHGRRSGQMMRSSPCRSSSTWRKARSTSPQDGDRHPEPVDELGIALSGPSGISATSRAIAYGIRAGAPRVLALLDRYRITGDVHGGGRRARARARARARHRRRRATRCAPMAIVGSISSRWTRRPSASSSGRPWSPSRTPPAAGPPAGSRAICSPSTRAACSIEEGFSYHMDDYSDDVPRLGRLGRQAHRDHALRPRLERHEDVGGAGLHARAMAGYAVETFEVLYDGRRGRTADDVPRRAPSDHRPARPHRYFERFIQHVRSRPRVWIATREEIAERWAAAHPRPPEGTQR